MTGLLTRRYTIGSLVLGATVLALMIGIFMLGGRAAAGHVSCGDVLLADTTLDSDLVCTGDGLVIGADGITVDLGLFAISGDGDVGDLGIDNTGGFDGVTIKNGEITAFDHAVRAIGADDLTLRNLDVVGPSGAGDSHAIDILDSAGLTIKNLDIDQSAGDLFAEAIRLEGVSDVLVQGVSILGGFVGVNFACGDCDLTPEAPTNGVIRNNTIVGTTDNGILIANSTDATVVGNTIIGAGFAGIQVGFRDTTPAATGVGPDDVGVRGVTVSRNDISGTNGDGILVARGAHHNTILHNTVTGSSQDGIRVGGDGTGDDNAVEKNKTDSNDGDGIHVEGDRNTVDKNKANENGVDGINVDGDDNTITKNKTDKNTGDGINVDGDDNIITKNKSNRNDGDGIKVAGAGNTCSQTGPDKNRAKNNGGADFVGCP